MGNRGGEKAGGTSDGRSTAGEGAKGEVGEVLNMETLMPTLLSVNHT